MGWHETSPVDEGLRFIADYRRQVFTLTKLCARFRISRKTGYKWIDRCDDKGLRGFLDRSRRPHCSPHETSERVVTTLLGLRQRHPTWGAKKRLSIPSRTHPDREWPSRSTACDILKRHGLIPKARRWSRLGHPGRPQTPMTSPREMWTADFEGQFLTRDGVYCYPLTVVDGFSRYLLACPGLRTTLHGPAKAVFARLLRDYGLPQIIRTDNGVRFATTALGSLSRLSVWWIRVAD